MTNKITVLLPVFNEAENIMPIYNAIQEVFLSIPQFAYEIIFVNDGSTDNTLEQIKKIAIPTSNIRYLSFSKNFGKDNALMAGLQHSTGDALITIDADLQHPPELIPELVDWWKKGFEVVYTYREEKNQHANLFSQLASKLFYNILIIAYLSS